MTVLVALLSLTSWTQELDKILDRPGLSGAIVAAQVATPDGRILYSRNADLRVMPASNQKLLSVAFALHLFGPDYKPETRIWKLADRIVVDCPGDPLLSEAQLMEAREKLNIQSGTPVFVKQGFRPGHGPGWEWDDLMHRYAPSISAFTVSRGGFEVFAGPTGVQIEPKESGVRVRTIDGQSMSWDYNSTLKILTFRGPLPSARRRLEAFALPEPDKSAAMILASSPAFPTETVPTSKPDLVISGKPMSEMARLCLQPSDNYLAECLMMMAAQKSTQGKAGSFSVASREMNRFLTQTVGLKPGQMDPYDGSGLSRHNNVTASGIVGLLNWARKQPTWRAWFDGMAVPGSGTLANRLGNSSFRGKTGTLNKVVSLSGYCRLNGGEEVSVSVIVNHFLGGNAVARDAVDEFIKKLESSSPNGPFLAAHPNCEGNVSYAGHRNIDAHRVR